MPWSRRSDGFSRTAEFCSGCGDMQSGIGARRSWYAQECVGLGGRQRGIGEQAGCSMEHLAAFYARLRIADRDTANHVGECSARRVSYAANPPH